MNTSRPMLRSGPSRSRLRNSVIAASICAGLVFATVAAASAATLPLNGLTLGAGSASVPVESFQSMRFRQTIKQAYDFSCGSAALATLLTYAYHRPTTEKTVFLNMIQHGDKQAIEHYGFSLLDMKNYLAREGIPSGGFDAPLEKLAELHVPAIVLINDHGYHHFVVLRSIRKGRLLISDPAVGMRTESVSRFRKQWSGIFFLILSQAPTGQHNFTDPNLWQGSPSAPTEIARYALSLAQLQQVTIPVANRF